MAKLLTPDICVIGIAGFAIAAAAASLGAPVVLVEPGRPADRSTLAALVAAGKRAHAARTGAGFGVPAWEAEIDFRALGRHLRTASEALAINESVERLTALGVPAIKAEARFTDRTTLIAGETEIRARRFVIATGSTPVIPAIPGLDSVEHLTEQTLAGLARKPGHLIVLGAGPSGLAMAQAYRRLGVDVTVIEPGVPLTGEDPEMVALLLERLRGEGVAIHAGARIARIEKRGKAGLRVEFEQDGKFSTLDGTHVLAALGRAPGIAGLDLHQAGVGFNAGGITVSPDLRTANSRIYAIGEAVDPMASAALIARHASLVVGALLLRRRGSEDRRTVPRLVMTEPQLAQVGLTEADLPKSSGMHVLRVPYAENERAQAERSTAGHLKLLADPGGRILGVSILGAEAGEAIAVWALALRKGLTLADMAAYVPARPTFGEIGKNAAMTYLAGMARKPSARRWVRLLRAFG